MLICRYKGNSLECIRNTHTQKKIKNISHKFEKISKLVREYGRVSKGGRGGENCLIISRKHKKLI